MSKVDFGSFVFDTLVCFLFSYILVMKLKDLVDGDGISIGITT